MKGMKFLLSFMAFMPFMVEHSLTKNQALNCKGI
jgi:hypothetical protein